MRLMSWLSCGILAQLSLVVHAQDAQLPSNLKWLSNDAPPLIASLEAKPGGTLRTFMTSYPLTFREVGPDSNGAFRGFFDSNKMSLINVHPNTEELIPELAIAWAYGDDKKTMYYRLDPKASWSDGKPVTVDDFLYTLEFYRSPHIVAPWYNEYYTTQWDRIIKFDSHTMAVVLKEAKPELHLYADMSPLPAHFYGTLDKDFVKNFNWKVAPVTGPYQISDFKKGKSVTFSRVKNWWAQDRAYYKNRFNIEKVDVRVIRDVPVAFEHLKKGEIDLLGITLPEYWHDKTNDGPFKDGYIQKIMFYNDSPASDFQMEMNTAKDLFKDINVRLGFAHAVNIERVIEKVLRNDYERLEGISRGYGKFTNTAIKARRYDLKQANEYFDKAGYKSRGPDGIRTKEGKRLTATLVYSNHAIVGARLVVMREELKKAGFELNLQEMDASARFKYYQEKKHDLTYMAWSTSLRPTYFEFYHCENANKPQTNSFTNICEPELDKLVSAQRSTTDINESVKLAHAIQQKVHDLGIIVPLFNIPYFRYAYWRWIRLPKVPATKTSDGLNFFGLSEGGLMWIDDDVRKETDAARKGKKAFPPVTLIDNTFKQKS